jgi:excisionase family DNA binding protein
MEKKYLTAREAAALLNVTDRTLLRWRKRKLLLPKTIGGKLLYDVADIEKALHNPE